jgi:hypothetical protein
MHKIVTEHELAHLEDLLAQSHSKHGAASKADIQRCTEPKCVQVRWCIEWLRRSRTYLSGARDYKHLLWAFAPLMCSLTDAL